MAGKKKLKDGDISSWITVKGEHIPVKEGQSKAQAVKQNLKAAGNKTGTKAKYDKVLSKKEKKGKK